MITNNMVSVDVDVSCNKQTKQMLLKAAMFYLEQLKITESIKPIDITISLIDLDAKGYCDFNEDYKYPEVTIFLDSKITSRNDLLTTLAHECVHAKQFLKRELKFDGKNGYWKKTLYESQNQEVDNNSPWEAEAYGREEELFRNFELHERV